MKKIIKPQKIQLEQMYLEKLMTAEEIAEKFGVADSTIGKWLKEYEIPVRTPSEVKLKGVVKPTKKVLERMYLDDKLNTYEIAEKLGVVYSTVRNWLKSYEIPIRTNSESKLKGAVKSSKEVLEKMYLEELMSIYEIAEKIGVAASTVRIWLKEYKIPMRTISEAMLKGTVKPSKEVLERMYLEKQMSTKEIAEKHGIHQTTVSNWLKEYEIPMRTPSEAKLKGIVKPTNEVLERMYLVELMTTEEIAEKVGVADPTIGRWLKEYEIPVRTISEAMLKGTVKLTNEVLERMYLEKRMSTYEIAEKLGIEATTIGYWLKEYGIPIRTTSESLKGKYTGEKSGNWKGGLSFLPYCDKFNNRLKEKIRNRDNYTCQNCDVKENGEKHSVHHVHYDKENCSPDLITVCRSCNAKANSNRDEWEIFYMNKLNDRGLLHWTSSNGI